MPEVRRWRCGSCKEIFPDTEVLIAKHPFAVGSISGCPRCSAALDSEAVLVCDVPGCDEDVSCGWPSKSGYRKTCSEHRKEGLNGE